MIDNSLGKKAEKQIWNWLDRPNDGYCFDRLYDRMTGFYGSKNICDFTLFKSPYMYYIESKATWGDNFPFSMISEYQYDNLLLKSRIENVFGIVIVLFADAKRSFILNIQDIDILQKSGQKSLNIKKIDKWLIRYKEIQTIQNNRKELLDYEGEWSIE